MNILVVRICVGILLHFAAPGYSSCGRCRVPWKYTEPHSTRYTLRSGMFPLDEWCWSRLTTQERLPYYRKLWESWEKETPGYASWADIESAVLAEPVPEPGSDRGKK